MRVDSTADGIRAFSLDAIRAELSDRYAVQSELGRGGMGIVYLARDLRLDRPVALKVLPPLDALSERRRQEFLREAKLAAGLSHPNIVPVHALEMAADTLCIALSYVRGESLRERIERTGPAAPEAGLRILLDVARALDHAHAHGIVHRDVKPGNVFLEEDGGRALLGDFGIAFGAGPRLTWTGVAKGTAGFASPEQLTGLDVDARCDLYGLGATAWYVFTGERPPPATATRPDLAARRPDLPLAVSDVVGRCLAAEPGARPSRAREVAEVFGRELAKDDPVPATVRRWIEEPRAVSVSLLAITAITLLSPRDLLGDSDFWMGMLVFWGAFVAYRYVRTVGVARSGYRPSDLRSGLRLWLDHRCYATSRGGGRVSGRVRGAVGRAVRWAAAASWGSLFAMGVLVADFTADPHPLAPLELLLLLGLVALLFVGWVWPAWAHRPDDLLSRLRLRFWRGRAGAGWYALTRPFVRRPSGRRARSGEIGRHTELVLGEAVDELFDRLPAPMRRELASVPGVVKELEGHVLEIRAGLERLASIRSEMLSRLSGADLPDASELALELEQRRVHLERRRHQALTALERLRVGMLGLAAGVDTPGGLEDTLTQARALRAHMDRLAEALRTAEALLGGTPDAGHDPSSAPTPVWTREPDGLGGPTDGDRTDAPAPGGES